MNFKSGITDFFFFDYHFVEELPSVKVLLRWNTLLLQYYFFKCQEEIGKDLFVINKNLDRV